MQKEKLLNIPCHLHDKKNCDECLKPLRTFLKLTEDFGVNTANKGAESHLNNNDVDKDIIDYEEIK